MAKPIVAVVGRPNVGKSTFFNKMAGARISIVEDTPGVTRDRVYADVSWQNYDFTLVDTGGIDPYSDDPLLTQMRAQANIAIETADVILFFVDGREGLTGADYEVADMLRRTKKPVLLVVNKLDTPSRTWTAWTSSPLASANRCPSPRSTCWASATYWRSCASSCPIPRRPPPARTKKAP